MDRSVAMDERYGLLRVYSFYRFALGILLLMMYFALRRADNIDLFQPVLYLAATLPYAAFNLLTLVMVLQRPRSPRPRHLFMMLVLDIATLVIVTHASGGLNSGFAVLLMVSVASAAVFLRGQIALLVAAVASLAVLGEAVYSMLTRDAGIGDVFTAGMLGLGLFFISFVVQQIASRLASSQDLVRQVETEVIELQQLNQLIVQRMRTGIVFIDAGDRVRMSNDAASHLLGIGARDITERDAPLPQGVTGALQAWRRNPRHSEPPKRIHADGPLVQLTFARLQSGGGDGTLVFAEDFSKIAQQAQQLKLVSLGRLTASIAHEIRNPLGSISHAAQLLREAPELPSEDKRLVDIVIGNARRTNEVIESVLTLSRGNEARPEQIDLRQWLARFVEELQLRDTATERRVRLEIRPATLLVAADPVQLRQVLNNLCENGLRYSQRTTGVASLLLRGHIDPDSALAQLDVVDDGPGVADKDIGQIFEPFFTTETSGNGLGLYLSRELCEANRISLEYRREAGAGSCFSLRFTQTIAPGGSSLDRPSP